MRRFVVNCTAEGLVRFGDKCLSNCPVEAPFSDSGICIKSCGNDFYINVNGVLTCVEKCQNNFFTYEAEVGPEGGKRCVKSCAEAGRYYKLQSQSTNLTECVDECPVFLDVNASLCVSACEKPFVNELGMCLDVTECPAEYPRAEALSGYTLCSSNCSDGKFTATNGTCMETCPPGEFADGIICTKTCNFVTLDKVLGHYKCVSDCQYFRQEVIEGVTSRVCVSCDLEAEFYFEGSGARECTDSCPEYVTQGHRCVSACPTGTVALGGACLNGCPSSMVSAGGECIAAENKESWFAPNLVFMILGTVIFGLLFGTLVFHRCRKVAHDKQKARSGYTASKVYIPGVNLLK